MAAMTSGMGNQTEIPSQQRRDATLEQLHQQAAMLSKMPVVSKLLNNPDAVSQLASQSPVMDRMLALNPFMKDMLQPQAVGQLLQAAQNPQALQNLLGLSLCSCCQSTTIRKHVMLPLSFILL